MDFPQLGPNLKSTKQLWDLSDRREWNNLSEDYIRRPIRSMPGRCQAVFRANDRHRLLVIS